MLDGVIVTGIITPMWKAGKQGRSRTAFPEHCCCSRILRDLFGPPTGETPE